MRICDWTSNGNTRPCASVVRALWRWLSAIIIEAKRNRWFCANLAWFHECVFLLNAIPRIVILVFGMDLGAGRSSVTDGRLIIPGIVRISEHQYMRISTERV